jgi:hypothetical protein
MLHRMQNNLNSPTLEEAAVTVAPQRILESIVSELELLCADSPLAARSDLIELHGALLVFELGGQLDLVPSIGFAFNGRRVLEARVARAARRIIGISTPELAVMTAGNTIEELIHLIDPELRILAA